MGINLWITLPESISWKRSGQENRRFRYGLGNIFYAISIGGVVYGAAALIWFALTILANWLMFMKAGEAGWKSIIPVYNTYTAYKIAWTPNMFWIYFIFTVLESIFSSISGGDFWSFSGFLGGLCGLVTIVLSVFYCVNLAKSFGKGLGFTIGLIFLEPIFVMMIAFGSARYQKY